MSALVTVTGEIFENWVQRMVSRLGDPVPPPTRDQCSRCAGSRMIAVLGEFGGLPHHLVHPLIGYLDQLLDSRAEDRRREELHDLRDLWLIRVDLDEDGEAPSADHLAELSQLHELELEALEMLVGSARETELAVVCSALAKLCETYREVAVQAVARIVDAAIGVVLAVDVDRSEITAAERAVLQRATRAILEHWMIWLPRPVWKPGSAIPAGLRCARCAVLDLRIDAPHVIAHRLTELVDELISEHLSAYARPAEPPGDGGLPVYRAAVQDVVVAAICADSEAIDRALSLYIRPLVDDVVQSASAFLDVFDEGGDETDGD